MVNEMIDDPIVKDIHRKPKEYSDRNGNDLDRIVGALREFERTSGREYANFKHRWSPVRQASVSNSTLSCPGDHVMARRVEISSIGSVLLRWVILLALGLQSVVAQPGTDPSNQNVLNLTENPKYAAVIAIVKDHSSAVEKERRTILAKWGNPRFGEPREARTFTVPLKEQDRKIVLRFGNDCLREVPVDWKGVFIALDPLSHDMPCKSSQDFVEAVFRQPWPPDAPGWQAAISIGMQVLTASDNRSARKVLFNWATLSLQDPRKRKFFPSDQVDPNFDSMMMLQTVDAYVHSGPVDAIVPFAQRVAKAHGPDSRYREQLESYTLFAERVAGGEINAMFRVE